MSDGNPSGRLDAVLTRLEGVLKSGTGWKALCPAHQDRNASLSLSEEPNGNILVHCFSGCLPDAICDRLGLKLADLMPPKEERPQRVQATEQDRIRFLIKDKAGRHVATHVRIELSDGSKRFTWEQPDGTSGLNGTKGADLPLYGTERVKGWQAGSPIIVTEGEKKCVLLWKEGFQALATATGASTIPGAAPLGVLDGFQVYLWPDNDAAGKKHMQAIGTLLEGLGIEARMVRWAEAGPKEDAADAIRGGFSIADLLDLAEPFGPGAAGTPEIPDEPLRFPRTDSGNAELFASLYGDSTRFDHSREQWLSFKGHIYRDDSTDQIMQMAKAAARHRLAAAADFSDGDEMRKEVNWALGSESHGKIVAALSLAESTPPFATDRATWNNDQWLMGLSNGVMDLRTGRLRKGKPDDHISCMAGVPFDPSVSCTRWEMFLTEVFDGDMELVDFIHKAIGYTLTGDTSEQCWFLCHGKGSNGKSVFLRTISYVLGEYGTTLPFTTLESGDARQIPEDLAGLLGKRFAAASEAREDSRLNEAKIKNLTGQDVVTARYLYGHFFSFIPEIKLWVATNPKPQVRDDSMAFWRRARMIPFLRQFSGKQVDKDLEATLRTEGPGILAWAVEGCLRWQKDGLKPPPAVMVATKEWRDDANPLVDFLNEACVEGAAATIKSSVLYKAYSRWAEDQGLKPRDVMSMTSFGRKMGQKYNRLHSVGGAMYEGVTLKNGGQYDAFR